MTSEFAIWLHGAPVVPTGDAEFAIWLDGAPVVEVGVGAGGGLLNIGTRIVSPRRERVNRIDYSLTPFHVRLVSPRIPIGRMPFYA